MSITASGTIANTVTMLRQLSRNIAKKKSRPTGAPSNAQAGRRAYYRQASAAWMVLTPIEKSAYKPGADAAQITPYNLYMRDALRAYIPTTNTVWDGGLTTWDSGTTVWD